MPFMYTTLGPVSPHIDAGTLVVLGVADPRRSPLAPNVPTFAEAGFKDAEVGAWQGFMGPPGLPANILSSLNGHLNEILTMADVRQRLTAMFLVPAGGEPSALAKASAGDFAKYAPIVREFGIQAD